MKGLKIIGVASGIGAQDHRCEDGPVAIRQSNVLSAHVHRDIEWVDTLKPAAKLANPVDAIVDLSARLAQIVCNLTHAQQPFAVFGGDHSMAIGTWSGARSGLAHGDHLGLIWIDAHMDSHTPDTTPSGAVHGMPLAALLGYGDPRFMQIANAQPALLAPHVCLIGIRSFERGEASLLERLGVRIFTMQEVQERGLNQVVRDAIAIVSNGTAGFGVTVDLDALDPTDAPGVGSPSPGGIVAAELLEALAQINSRPQLLGVEIAEYNPARDIDQRTARLAAKLLQSMMGEQS